MILIVLEVFQAFLFGFLQKLSDFVRIDAPMYFLQPPTPKSSPKESKNAIFTEFSKIMILGLRPDLGLTPFGLHSRGAQYATR